MVLFKINGERNCGTTFLEMLLANNGYSSMCHNNYENKIVRFWKHGVPNDNVKKIDNRVVDIFIFRNLEEWLVSMYHNPYELSISKDIDFEKFLTKKQKSCLFWTDYDTMKPVSEDDDGKTIFEIREHKFKKICEYKDRNKDIVFVNLSFIQNEKNCEYFLDKLSEKYMQKPKPDKYILSFPHTKNRSIINEKNRIYNINIDDYKDIIDLNKNNEMEDYINKLTLLIE